MIGLGNEPLSDLDSLVLTPFGYGCLTQSQDSQAVVRLSWGATAHLSASLLRRDVTVYVKMFVGDRKLSEHTLQLTETFDTLFSKLCEELGLSKSFSLKLFYPMGRIKEVRPSDTSFSLSLQQGAKLVAVMQQIFVWDENARGSNIEVVNSGRTVVKRNEEDYESVLTNAELSSGKHSWEITVDRYMRHEDIFIGVAQKGLPLYTRPPETGMFWGYLCTG